MDNFGENIYKTMRETFEYIMGEYSFWQRMRKNRVPLKNKDASNMHMVTYLNMVRQNGYDNIRLKKAPRSLRNKINDVYEQGLDIVSQLEMDCKYHDPLFDSEKCSKTI